MGKSGYTREFVKFCLTVNGGRPLDADVKRMLWAAWSGGAGWAKNRTSRKAVAVPRTGLNPKDKLDNAIREKNFLIAEMEQLKARLMEKTILAARMEMEVAELDATPDAVPNFVSAGSLYMEAGMPDAAAHAFKGALELAEDRELMENLVKTMMPIDRWKELGL
jgi:hypothetical protein